MISHNGKTYFTESELRCKGTGKLKLADGFAEKLLEIRLKWNRPMIINSACRALEHNRRIGSSDGSYHVCDDHRGGCMAVDVRMVDAKLRADFIELALSLGWSVGVNKTFIHIDRRVDTGVPRLMFTY